MIVLGSSYQITPHPTRIEFYITQQFRAKSKSRSMMLCFSDKKTMEAGTGHHELLMCRPCQYVVAASRQRKQALSTSKQHRIRAFLSSQENLTVFFSTQTNLGLSLGPNNSKLSRPKHKENNFQFATRRAAANSRFYRSSCARKYHFHNHRKTSPSSETNN